MEPLEVIGSALIFLMSALANSTGIGGGEIMVPLLILLFLFETHAAVPLSLMIMLGGSFITTLMRIPLRHPSVDRPLISYSLVAHTLCPLLIGSTSGVLINRSIPDWLILFTMTALLFYLTVHISMKAHHKYILSKSSKEAKNQHEIHETVADIEVRATPAATEYRVFPARPSMVIFAIYVFAMVTTFARGDIDSPSPLGIEYCSVGYWVMIAWRILALLGLALVGMCRQVRETRELIAVNYDFSHDLKWSHRNVAFLGTVALVAGLGVGVLGIGGGAILYPALTFMGIEPEVAKASAGAMMLLACSVTVIQYMIAGMLAPSYAAWFFVLAAAGASGGTIVIGKITKKIGKKYLPIVIFACALGITTMITPTFVITTIVNGMNNSNFQYGFKNYCDN